MKTIITCAVTGAHTSPRHTPYLPITPDQIADSALEAADAGAAVVHIHVRDPETKLASMDLDLYCRTVEKIRQANNQVLINLTCGPGASGSADVVFGTKDSGFKTAQERTQHIVEIKPDICSLDLNTMNRGPKNITVNSVKIIKEMATIMRSAGVKPELEIFDSGDMQIAHHIIDQGYINGLPLIQIATGIRWGWESTIDTLDYAKRILPKECTWYAFGIGLQQMPFVALSTLNGGHARVGMEDNIYLNKDVLAKSNAELVNKAVRIITDLGNEIASPAEARNILEL